MKRRCKKFRPGEAKRALNPVARRYRKRSPGNKRTFRCSYDCNRGGTMTRSTSKKEAVLPIPILGRKTETCWFQPPWFAIPGCHRRLPRLLPVTVWKTDAWEKEIRIPIAK